MLHATHGGRALGARRAFVAALLAALGTGSEARASVPELALGVSPDARRGAEVNGLWALQRWAGSELPISEDHPDGLVSSELLVGLRWSFWSPEWHPPQGEVEGD